MVKYVEILLKKSFNIAIGDKGYRLQWQLKAISIQQLFLSLTGMLPILLCRDTAQRLNYSLIVVSFICVEITNFFEANLLG